MRSVRVEREGAFWFDVASHPEVREALLGADPASIAAFVAQPHVIPLASQNGGYIFIRRDSFGRVVELHSMFKPEGWGREALEAGLSALRFLLAEGVEIVVTYEIEGRWRTRPPKTFRFVPSGPFAPSPVGLLRTWVLTGAAFEASPVYKRG